MFKKERVFTEDEQYLLGEFYTRCSLAYWLDWSEYMKDPEKVMNKIGQILVPIEILEDMPLSEYQNKHGIIASDSKWEELSYLMSRKDREGDHPLRTNGMSEEANSNMSPVEAVSFLIDFVSQHGVPEHVANYVDPKATPQYIKEQRAIAKAQNLVNSMKMLNARNEVVF